MCITHDRKKGEFNFSSVPSMSSKERNNISQQSIAPQSSLLKSQSKQNSYCKQNYLLIMLILVHK